jgi:micrococcal nuclease
MYHRRLGYVVLVSVSLASFAVVLSSVGQTNTPTPVAPSGASTSIPAEQAKQHIGETNTVCGLVASARYMDSTRAKPTLLNFVKPYPDHAFSVMIPNPARSKFPEPPETFFTGKTVCVTGAIIEYRGKPEIVVQEPSQMVVTESAAITADKTATNAVQQTPPTPSAPTHP